MRAKAEEALAILVDIQEKLLPVMHNKEEFLSSCLSLVKGFQILGIPLLSARQYPKGLGPLVSPLAEALDRPSYDKLTFSVMGAPAFRQALKESGRRQIFVFGIETHICVLQSVLDLLAAGYEVYLVADCTTSRKESDHQLGLARAAAEGAKLTSREAALFELLGEAGSETFKEISRLVK